MTIIKNCLKCRKDFKGKKKEPNNYVCEKCGLEIDRDINAAKNIEKEGIRMLEVPMECREVKLVERTAATGTCSDKQFALKQETATALA